MNKVSKLFTKWTLIFLLGSSLYVYYRYSDEKQQILDQVDQVLLQASQSVKYILPEGFHRTARQFGVPEFQDRENIRRLTEFAKERGLRFIYSLSVSNTNIIFCSSSLNDQESIDNPEVRYGFIYDDPSPTLKKAFTTTGMSSESSENKWGKYHVVYWTRTISERQGNWVAGAEYNQETYDEQLTEALFKIIRELFYGYLLFLILFFPYVKNLKRKLRVLTEDVNISYSRYNKDIMQRGK